MTKIGYTACERHKNDNFVQWKVADNLNCMCPELNAITDSNQPQQGGSMNENRVVDQVQLRTVLGNESGRGETNAFSSIYQLKQFINKFADTCF